MSPSIACQVISLGKLLRVGDSFVVPPYQRNYAWEEEQYASFWSDISKTFLDCVHEYFLGSIVFDNSCAPDLRVIDGQQRLITTSLLISALRSHLAGSGHPKLAALIERNFLAKSARNAQAVAPCLILNSNDRTFYDTYIFSKRLEHEIFLLAKDDTLIPSNRLIAECFSYMHRKIADLCDAGHAVDQLAGAIISALNHRVFLIRIDVKDDANAFMVFETLNDRGVELSEADLLKNHLFAASRGFLTEVQANWDAMEQNLGAAPPLKFIRHHWLAMRGGVSEHGLYADLKTAIATPEAAFDYSRSLCDAAEHYAALACPEHPWWSGFSPDRLSRIQAGLKSVGIMRSEQLYIILLAALAVDPSRFEALLRMLVNFSFRYSTICNFSASNLSAPFIAASRHIRESGTAIADEIFHRFLARLYPDDAQFHSAFSRKTSRNNALSRHILAALNDYLTPAQAPQAVRQAPQAVRQAPQAVQQAPQAALLTEADGSSAAPVLRLEHILPKRYQSAWQATRKEFPGGPEKYIHRLGNMTLIPEALNHELGNAPFEIKRREFARQSLEITRRIAESDKWTAEEISRRQNWMAGLAVRIWRFPETGAS